LLSIIIITTYVPIYKLIVACSLPLSLLLYLLIFRKQCDLFCNNSSTGSLSADLWHNIWKRSSKVFCFLLDVNPISFNYIFTILTLNSCHILSFATISYDGYASPHVWIYYSSFHKYCFFDVPHLMSIRARSISL